MSSCPRFVAFMLPCLLLSGVPHGSLAAPILDYEVSTDGVGWSKFVAASAGQTVSIRAFVRWHDVAAFGFSGVLHQIRLSSPSDGDRFSFNRYSRPSGDLAGWRVAPFAWGTSAVGMMTLPDSKVFFQNGAGGYIGPVGYLSSAQRSPYAAGASYSTDRDALILQFTMTTSIDSPPRSIFVDSLLARDQAGTAGDEFAFHTSAIDTSSKFRSSGTVSGATIQIGLIPTPNTFVVALAGFTAMGRRSRPSARV